MLVALALVIATHVMDVGVHTTRMRSDALV